MTRHSFERQAKSLLAAATETAAHSILYLDIDRLHVINETFGMHVGDDVIVSVAECMAKALPAKALSARISGDRLAALIPDSSMEAAAELAERIRAAAAGIVPRAGQGSFEVSASLGVGAGQDRVGGVVLANHEGKMESRPRHPAEPGSTGQHTEPRAVQHDPQQCGHPQSQ